MCFTLSKHLKVSSLDEYSAYENTRDESFYPTVAFYWIFCIGISP